MGTIFPPNNQGNRFCLHTFGNGTSQNKCNAKNSSQSWAFILKFQKSFNLHFKHCRNTWRFIMDRVVCHLCTWKFWHTENTFFAMETLFTTFPSVFLMYGIHHTCRNTKWTERIWHYVVIAIYCMYNKQIQIFSISVTQAPVGIGQFTAHSSKWTICHACEQQHSTV